MKTQAERQFVIDKTTPWQNDDPDAKVLSSLGPDADDLLNIFECNEHCLDHFAEAASR